MHPWSISTECSSDAGNEDEEIQHKPELSTTVAQTSYPISPRGNVQYQVPVRGSRHLAFDVTSGRLADDEELFYCKGEVRRVRGQVECEPPPPPPLQSHRTSSESRGPRRETWRQPGYKQIHRNSRPSVPPDQESWCFMQKEDSSYEQTQQWDLSTGCAPHQELRGSTERAAWELESGTSENQLMEVTTALQCPECGRQFGGRWRESSLAAHRRHCHGPSIHADRHIHEGGGWRDI